METFDDKIAVSPSTATTCSAADVGETRSAQRNLYARIQLKGFAGYTQPLADMGVFLDDVQDANKGDVWTIEIIEMTRDEYEALPEFEGY